MYFPQSALWRRSRSVDGRRPNVGCRPKAVGQDVKKGGDIAACSFRRYLVSASLSVLAADPAKMASDSGVLSLNFRTASRGTEQWHEGR